MPDLNEVDYIIAGQGLAGSAVAVQLMNRQKKILVIDQFSKNTSSRVAAGLFNPVTGRKMTKTWLADLIFPCLHQFYRTVEELTHQKFFYSLPLYRPFLTVEEQNEWMAKSADSAFELYIEKIATNATIPGIRDSHGGLLLAQSGYLNTVAYLHAVRTHIDKTNVLLDENFASDALILKDNSVEYKGYKASKIIFCQGEHIATNKWFNWVPVNPLKGETLKIETPCVPQQIINRGVYVVPGSKNELKVGSTYNFQDKKHEITAKARIELEGKLNELVSFSYKITDQEWGMRPTTPDRRPILGPHPEFEPLVIFNGMGTKGVSLTPYFSEILVNWLNKETDLIPAVNVSRYKSLYSKSTK